MKRNKKVILLTLLLMSALFVSGFTACSNTSQEQSDNSVQSKTTATDTLFFTSDYQADSSFPAPQETFRGLLRAVKDNNQNLGQIVLCGDYSNVHGQWDYQISPSQYISEIKSIVTEECPEISDGNMIFLQGNHDALTDDISDSGLHEYDDYMIYVLNTQTDFPWKQGVSIGSKKKVEETAETMKTCFDQLISDGEKRPIFIAAHVPLHFSARTSSRHTSGDNLYSKLIFDTLNEAAKSLDIVYLYGHNHSKGWDCYLGGSCVFKAVGDEILIPDYSDGGVNTNKFSVEKLRFTYMNAGYTGYYKNCGDDEEESETLRVADNALTGTVAEVKQDEIVLSRYSINGKHHLGGKGTANPYKDNIDEDLIASEYYSKEIDGPMVIARKNK